MNQRFKDRREAGKCLATALAAYAKRGNAVVLALPRGGVPVAYEISKSLLLPLDVLLVRKLGVPGEEELAMGAITWNQVRILNEGIVKRLNIPESVIEQVERKEKEEISRRNSLYRGDREPLNVRGKTVIIVDDGLATGATMKAAIAGLRKQKAGKIVVAIPVGDSESFEEIRQIADDLVCLRKPDALYGVGFWYRDFSQTSDEEVQDLLARSRKTAVLHPTSS